MQDLKSNQTCAQVVVSAQKSLQLSKRLEQFETQFPKMQSQFSKSTESIYYLVSTKFIRQWKAFIQDSSPNRLEISEMNIDIVNPETKLLQEGMLENQNFEIVNQQIYNIFEGFKVFAQLKRIAYMDGDEKKVPIYTVQIEYMTLTQKDLHAFDRKQKTRQHLTLTKISCLSQNNLVLDLKKAIESQEMINKNYQTRIWSHEKSITLDIFFNHILTQCGPLSFDLMKIKALGKLLDNVEQKLGDVGLEEGQYFILECIQYNKFVISAGDQGRCQSCYHYKKLPFPCGCKQVSYCTQQCLEKDRRHHIPRCKLAQQEQLKKAIQMVMRPTSRRGLVGLQNLGNTCFMNSCLQCLSHTLNLTNYFLQQRYSQEINQQNPIGSKGKLAQAYAAFIKNMWCQQQSTYRPYRLKSAIADINKMFSGYAQHDSQELFSFLVDGLHEDLNRIKRKPYVESVDSNGRTDQIVSHESWLAYIKRNQSIISDNMVGQYRSKVVCPDCGKQSITFDPFITVTLPIPEKISNIMELFVLRQDNQQQTIKISVRYRERSVEQIIKQISIIIEKPSSDFLCYVLTFQENIYPFHNTPKTELFSKIEFLHSQIFVIQISNQEKQLQNRIQIPCRFTKKEYNRFESFWFKRPFFFNIEQATGLTLLKRVLKYFYHDTYNCSLKRTQMQKSQNKWKKVEEGKSYQQYEAYMLKNRPCKVYVKWNKRMKYSYSLNSQIEFEQQKCIEDDQMLKDFIDLNNLQNYEIQYRFNAVGLENFSIKRLRNFSQKKTHHGSEMVDESQGNMSLDDCFEALQTPELLQKGNEWYCPSCKDHKLATKQINIYKTPQVLILHLKRFKVKAITRRQKNEANVNFPFNLDMSRYVLNQKPINDYIPYVKSQNVYIQPSYELIVNPNANPHYELYAISNHYGSLGGGHYTAYAKNEDKWYSFNDSSVSGVNADKVKGSGAYILFYRRRPN